MVECNASSADQLFTYDGKHLHHKATLSVGLWSPCEKLTEDDQWWSFALKNGTSGALAGLVEMKGVSVHGKAPCLDVDSAASASAAAAAAGSLKATSACDASKLGQQWTLASPVSGSVLQNGGGLCVERVASR
jgi:hypothetical protein